MKKARAMYIPAGGKKAVWGPVDQNVLPEGYPYKEGSKTVIEWDGNTDGLTEVVLNGDGQTVYQAMYKVSDLTPSVSELSENGVFNAPTMGIEGVNISSEHFIVATDEVCLGFEGLLAVAYKAGANAAGVYTFPEPGVYFVKNTPEDMAHSYVSGLTYGTETIHPMAPEFLPAGVGGGVQVVTITQSDDNTYVSSHTGAQIREMLKNGPVVATIGTDESPDMFTANFLSSAIYPEAGMNYVVFNAMLRMNDTSYVAGYYFIDGESTAVTNKSHPVNMS